MVARAASRNERCVIAAREVHVLYESEGMPGEAFVGAMRYTRRDGKALILEQRLVEATTGRAIARAWVVQLLVQRRHRRRLARALLRPRRRDRGARIPARATVRDRRRGGVHRSSVAAVTDDESPTFVGLGPPPTAISPPTARIARRSRRHPGAPGSAPPTPRSPVGAEPTPAWGGPGGYAPPPKTNTLAMISLIAGVAQFVCFYFIGAIVAIVTGHIARSQIRRSNGTQGGAGMALAGIILGYVGLALQRARRGRHRRVLHLLRRRRRTCDAALRRARTSSTACRTWPSRPAATCATRGTATRVHPSTRPTTAADDHASPTAPRSSTPTCAPLGSEPLARRAQRELRCRRLR